MRCWSPILCKISILIDNQLTAKLLEEVKLLREENKQLRLRVLELETKSEKHENPKNCSNSSVPPFQDSFRKTKSLRGKSKRKPDEQRLTYAMEKHRYLFPKFIKQPKVPFDINLAERDLRMI